MDTLSKFVMGLFDELTDQTTAMKHWGYFDYLVMYQYANVIIEHFELNSAFDFPTPDMNDEHESINHQHYHVAHFFVAKHEYANRNFSFDRQDIKAMCWNAPKFEYEMLESEPFRTACKNLLQACVNIRAYAWVEIERAG